MALSHNTPSADTTHSDEAHNRLKRSRAEESRRDAIDIITRQNAQRAQAAIENWVKFNGNRNN